MRRIRVSVSVGLVGCEVVDFIEVDDGDTDEQIEEAASQAMFNMIEWSWREAKPKED